MSVMWRRRRGALTPPDNASLCSGCAAAGLGAPLQKAVLEERDGPTAGWPAGLGNWDGMSQKEGTSGLWTRDTGPTLTCHCMEQEREKSRGSRASPARLEWVWVWLSLVLEISLPGASDFQTALHVVFLQLFDITVRLDKMCS